MTRQPTHCIKCGGSPAPWIVTSKVTGQIVRVCVEHHAEVAGSPRVTDLRDQAKQQ